MTVEELLGEVARDSCYYRRSHGGITLGGGEPTLQHAFVLEFLKRVNRLYIHTAMETCGHVKGENLTMLLPLVDLVYIDIKHMNPAIHKKLTGVSNDLILENARRAARVRPIIIRIPTVPGCNDSEENILATGRFAASLGEHLQRVELLPYHALGVQTYRKLGTRYELDDLKSPSATHLERLKGIIESCQITAQIGG
jgi:pyruvate formate lyase activating enzyme